MSQALQKAKLKLLDAQKEQPKVKEGRKTKHNSKYLDLAIETASKCTEILPEERDRVFRLCDSIEADKENDEYWEVRIKYHLKNLEIMENTYPRFQEEAIRRKSLIDKINKLNRWADEKEKCKIDTRYWFDNYSWTADPRKSGIWALPFLLYPYQYDAVDWFEELIFLKQSSGLVEKSRDLGLSWLLTALFYKHWQHPRDGVFSALMGSITSDECDKVGDPSSMFEKLRIQARLQPLGLLPKGWNCDIPYMKAVNPENGSTITGETSNSDFGRSGRYKCVTPLTTIFTDTGLSTFQELIDKKQTKIIAPDGSVKNIKHYITRPSELIWRVETELGYSVEGTADHPLLVLRDGIWQDIEIQNIKIGDELQLNKPNVFSSTNLISEDLARIFGYLISEGSVYRSGIIDFTNQEEFVMEDYLSSWERELGFRPRVKEVSRKSQFSDYVSYYKTSSICDIKLRTKWAELGLDWSKSGEKTIPYSVRNSSKEVQIAFLQSLYEGDGTVYSKDGLCVSYTSKSFELIKQLQIILLNFGLESSISKEKKKFYRLRMNNYFSWRFIKEIGFRSDRKNKKYIILDTPPKRRKKDRETVKVRYCEPTELESVTYDIECEDHYFIANGISTHNCILFDEFSAFEYDTAAMTASSQSSPCKIYNSTARGMGNEFYRLAHSGTVEKKTFHWTVHPYKTEDWYNYQKLEMSETQIAQELDINYDASQPNKVYSIYNEVMHVSTKSEVMRALPEFKDINGKFRIPFGHSIYMGEDIGQTMEHAHVMLWFVTLKEGTVSVDGIDMSGHVLCYREIIPAPKTPPRLWAEAIKKAEGIYEPRMVMSRYISHEATTEVEVYWDEYKLSFEKWNSDYNAGITRVLDYLDIMNKNKPHPFREHTRAMLYPKAPPIMGSPHLHLIVDDEQGKLIYDDVLKKYRVSPAIDSNGLLRLRGEFPAYHYPKSELGKDVKKMRPKKNFDDAMDVLRCVATECFAPINKKSQAELIEENLPESLKLSNIDNMSKEKLGMAFWQRRQEIDSYNKSKNQEVLSYRERLIKSAYKN